MDKIKLKHFLIAEEKILLEEARKDLQDYRVENSLDHDTVKDLDDLAQNDASSYFGHDLEARVSGHMDTIQHLEEINFAPTDTVKPGSIVKINGKRLVIASPKRPFQFEGETIEAISPSAPIFKEMLGKKAGDSYNFLGETFQIEEVH